VPAGNGTLVAVFAPLVGAGPARPNGATKAERQVAAFRRRSWEKNFFPLMTLLNGYELLQQRATELVIVGRAGRPREPRRCARAGLRQKACPDKNSCVA